MSEYATIEINGYSVCSFRNYLDKRICGYFFTDSDLTITPGFKYDSEDPDETPIERYMYTTTVSNARDRLDAMGFTISSFEKLLATKGALCVDYDSLIYSLRKKRSEEDHNEIIRNRFSKNVTLKKWINSTKKIIEYETIHGEISERSVNKDINLNTECDKIIYYSKINGDYVFITGYFDRYVQSFLTGVSGQN